MNDSYSSVKKLSLTRVDYIDFLTVLAGTAADILPENNERWSTELSDEASKLDHFDPNYLPARKNSIVFLSKTAPVKALNLFKLLAEEAPPKADIDEDVRTDAAIAVFSNAWKNLGLKSVPEIRDIANRMAENGGYPYRGMSIILRELARIQNSASTNQNPAKLATEIFQEAVNAYISKKRSFDNTNAEFLDLLQSAQFIVPESEYRRGLHTFVDALGKSANNDTADYSGTIYTPNGQISFRNRDRLLLFRVFPLVARIDEEDANILKGLYPEMASATGDVQSVWQGVIQGGVTQQVSDELEARMREGRILERLRTMASSDAQAALDLADQLRLPSNRVLGLTYVISATAKSDIAYARQLYAHQQRDAENISDAGPQLSSIVALAKSARHVNDDTAFINLTTTAFDSGEKAFRKPADHAYERSGYKDLRDLVEFGVANQSTWILHKIETTQDILLKAYLQISAAQGLSKQKPHAVAN